MINRSPWLWGTRKTAAGMTGRTSRGQQIIQGKRAKGQRNPSNAYLQAQQVAAFVSAWYHQLGFILVNGFTNIPTGGTTYSEFMKFVYRLGMDLSAPPVATPNVTGIPISRGVMTPTNITGTTTAVSATGVVTIHWDTTPVDASQDALDKMLVAVYNVGTNQFIGSVEVSDRSSGVGVVNCPIGSFTAAQLIGIYLGAVAVPGEANAGTSSPSTAITFTTT